MRETPETRLTPAEKRALLERERARMAEPGYRESLVPPPDTPEPRAVRPLPDWMPTPEELDEWQEWAKGQWAEDEQVPAVFTLLRAVRWLLEDRENR